MAGEGGTEATAVTAVTEPSAAAPPPGVATSVAPDVPEMLRALAQAPQAFDFFRAVRLIECAHADRPRIGADNRAASDPVRFGQLPSLAFAPTTVAGFETPAGQSPRLLVNFLGLLGPNGPMPLHLSDYALDRLRNHHDPTLARFLDLFNHRMIALFYRAWAHNQQAVGYDRGAGDRFSVYVASLIGIGVQSLSNRDAVGDVAKLHYSGRLLGQTKHAEGLRAILADYFRVPVEIEQFVGQWVAIPEESRCALGDSPETGTLGQTAIVGSRVWDVRQKFRIRLGPLDLAAYQKMLPGGASLARLVAWVRSYVGDEFDWDVRLVLKKQEVPPVRLGKAGGLGWSTWLHAAAPKRDADDLVLRPFAA
jgi:type VI secretion system protein ImpH